MWNKFRSPFVRDIYRVTSRLRVSAINGSPQKLISAFGLSFLKDRSQSDGMPVRYRGCVISLINFCGLTTPYCREKNGLTSSPKSSNPACVDQGFHVFFDFPPLRKEVYPRLRGTAFQPLTADRRRVARLPYSLHADVCSIVTPIESPNFDVRAGTPEVLQS